MKLLSSLLLCFTLSSFLPGNEIASDFVRINKKMAAAKAYSVKAKVVFNYTGTAQTLFVSSKKLGSFTAMSYMNSHFLSNKKMQVLVNTESKLIFVQDASEAKTNEIDLALFEKGIDSLIKKGYTYTLVQKTGDEKQVKTVMKEPALYAQINITYNAKTDCFRKIEYTPGKELNNSGIKKIEVVYSEFDYAPKLTEDDFDEAAYIQVKGKKILGPSAKFKGYKIIDQRLER